VKIDAPGITIVARPAGRPGESAAKFSGRYGQSTGVVIFDNVFVPWDNVFLAGEWNEAEFLTRTYATHHRHSCIGARAGFGDLLIGAGVLMSEAMKREIYRRYPLEDKAALVEQLLDCGVAGTARRDQPGRCCVTGCQVPETPPGKAAGKAAAE
jgi:4-hydroxybutyryl-CoA dehydratase / vinylacetyl-CoA-Delta-isomerase